MLNNTRLKDKLNSHFAVKKNWVNPRIADPIVPVFVLFFGIRQKIQVKLLSIKTNLKKKKLFGEKISEAPVPVHYKKKIVILKYLRKDFMIQNS